MSKDNKFSAATQYAVWKKTLGRCWYCGRQTEVHEDRNQCTQDVRGFFSVDHAVPKSQGGTNQIDNLLPACRSCNGAKRDRNIEEYRESLQWKGIGQFGLCQILWLRSHGIELPEPPMIVFYGEKSWGLIQ